jgi:hypothetical protein
MVIVKKEVTMKIFKIIFFMLIALTISLLNGCSGKDSSSGAYVIKYTFTGTRSATVTYFNSSDKEVSTTASPPWSYEFNTSDENHTVKVAAFSLSSGSATVNLYLNGIVKKTGSDGGSYGFNATTGTYKIKDIK